MHPLMHPSLTHEHTHPQHRHLHREGWSIAGHECLGIGGASGMFEGSNRDALPLFQGEASWGWGLVWGTEHPGIGWQKLSPVGAAGNGGCRCQGSPVSVPLW